MQVPTAPCGLQCGECPIFKAALDREAAESLAEAWRQGGIAAAQPEWFKCQGCYGIPSTRWSADCEIRACCVDQRALTSCSLCRDFPCEKLDAWAADAEHHAAALARLAARRRQAEAGTT